MIKMGMLIWILITITQVLNTNSPTDTIGITMSEAPKCRFKP